MRLSFPLLFLTVFTFVTTAGSADLVGTSDHPVISRYPGSEIHWYSLENHRAYRVPTGPVTGYRRIDDWIEVEGRVTRIYYALENAERTESEVYGNYLAALEDASFEILAQGLVEAGVRGGAIGSRAWQEVFFAENPFGNQGEVRAMVSGTSTSGGRGTVIGRKDRTDGPVYVAASVYRFSDQVIGTLVDVVEVEEMEAGLVAVDAEAIGKGLEENGRVVLDGILFDRDRATLRPVSRDALAAIARYLHANPMKSFYVVGHTDSEGTLADNRELSLARAHAVVGALVEEHGMDSARLEAHGVGPLVPVFSNQSPAGRERNRRVELVEK